MDWETLGMIVAGIVTLAIFSLLYKDNPFYRVAESLLVGVSAGYYVIHYFNASVINKFGVPVFRDGNLWMLPGGLLGLLILFRLNKKLQWLSRYAIAFYVAAWSGYLIPSVVQERILTQVAGSLPTVGDPFGWDTAGTLLILVGVISILIYFYFSAEHKGVLGQVSKVGITFLMIGFGASFGYTVMGRVSLLIGRFQFLFEELPQRIGWLFG
jgi:hypothetical protein